MSRRHTATWAVVASVLAHGAVLGWLPAFHRPAPLPPEAAPPRTLHAVLLPPPTVEPKAQPARTAPAASAAPAPRTAPRTARPAEPPAAPPSPLAPVALAPERTHTPSPTPATAQSSTATAFTAATPAADARPPTPQHPLELNLPRHTSQPGRWTGSPQRAVGRGAARGSVPVGPVAPEPSAAEQAAAAPLAPARPSVTGVVSVRERRGDTLAQAEVRTPWGRYCMRKRQSSRMTELHDSPFGQGMQATHCDRE